MPALTGGALVQGGLGGGAVRVKVTVPTAVPRSYAKLSYAKLSYAKLSYARLSYVSSFDVKPKLTSVRPGDTQTPPVLAAKANPPDEKRCEEWRHQRRGGSKCCSMCMKTPPLFPEAPWAGPRL